jgi:hypothetical protein
VLEVVDEQAEMLRMCRFMVRTVVYVLRTSFELWEEMEKDVLLDLNPR